MNRRNFLKNSLMTVGTITTLAGLMIKPKRLYAAWPKESFDITDLSDSINSVYGHNDLSESSEVMLKAPDIVEFASNQLFIVQKTELYIYFLIIN